MRTAAKVDANQREIVAALRSVGATVQPLHAVGQGCPDISVGWRGVNYFLEVKDGEKPPSARKLTPAQEDWHGGWKGHVAVVSSVAEALAAIGLVDNANGWQSVGNVAKSLVRRAQTCHEKEAGPKALPTPTAPDHSDDVRSINDGL